MDSPPDLSILLPTVVGRARLFEKLHAEILRQVGGRAIEVLIACDDKQISIGKKRQNLLEQAKGQYVCYIDDDDWITPDYVEQIMAAIKEGKDCIGFLISCTTDGKNPRMAKASLKYPRWGDNQDGFAYVRSPYQKTPVKRSMALLVGFPDVRYAEDRVYSAGLVRVLKTETFINRVLYLYRYRAENFNQKYGIKTATRPPNKTGSGSPRFDYKGRRVG